MHVTLEPCGLVVQVDEDVVPTLSEWRWSRHSAGYVEGRRGGRLHPERVLLHRLVMGSPTGKLVDHRHGDLLDNRRSQLRVTNQRGNQQNRHTVVSKTGYKGVTAQGPRFIAQIGASDGRNRYLGSFVDAASAARAYDAAAVELFGEFAMTNAQLVGGK